jgi:hypothetical protein
MRGLLESEQYFEDCASGKENVKNLRDCILTNTPSNAPPYPKTPTIPMSYLRTDLSVYTEIITLSTLTIAHS